jgi:hypothetical protein
MVATSSTAVSPADVAADSVAAGADEPGAVDDGAVDGATLPSAAGEHAERRSIAVRPARSGALLVDARARVRGIVASCWLVGG